MSFSRVVARGDRLVSLEALRDLLAGAIEVCESSRDLAALSQRLVDVLGQIEAAGGSVKIDDPEESTFDELSKRRATRGADAPRAESAPGS